MKTADWPDRRIQELFGIKHPIIQAPMAGSDSVALAAAVSNAGGLGSLACALLSPEKLRQSLQEFREKSQGPINLNFFCHVMPKNEPAAQERWKAVLTPHYRKLGLDPAQVPQAPLRSPFDAEFCAIVESARPEIVSFHFGMPDAALVARLKSIGIKILSSATSVAEARRLEELGCDAIIAQGAEAGGHRGTFLETEIDTQPGTLALVPQVVDAVSVPVIAAGGIADARGIAAAFMLGASAAQLGTAYLFCPEANVSPLYSQTLATISDTETVLTNVFSGRPARGYANRFVRECGPISEEAPPFPYAATLVGPLRTASEKSGSTDYMQMWSGQAARLARAMPAGELTEKLATEALAKLNRG